MIELGIEIMPEIPVTEVIATICAAEEIGYAYCLLNDERLMREGYAVLAAAALKTTRIRISPVTNGYTRHPALTAAGAATLNEISNGRAFVTLVAAVRWRCNPWASSASPLSRSSKKRSISFAAYGAGRQSPGRGKDTAWTTPA